MLQDLLHQPLATIQERDIHQLQRLAQHAFEPLIRPFREQKRNRVFSFSNTIDHAIRHGMVLPKHTFNTTPTRSAKLVIALSLNGIDRCYAVSLIPLLSQLRRYVDFEIYIYTTQLIPAVIRDGFFHNDCQLTWNHVYAPRAFVQLWEHLNAGVRHHGRERELLIIDSCGGAGSEWYVDDWHGDLESASVREYTELMREWSGFRKELDGAYHLWERVATGQTKRRLRQLINKNCERFTNCPALGNYLVRWLLNPTVDIKLRPSYLTPNYSHLTSALHSMRDVVANVHWMLPGGRSNYKHRRLIEEGLIDYVHHAEDLSQFGQVIANICHHRCTHKLTREPVTFGLFQAATTKLQDLIIESKKQETSQAESKSEEKTALVLEAIAVKELPDAPFPVIPETRFTLKGRGKEGDEKEKQVPYANIDPLFHYKEETYNRELTHRLESLFSSCFDDIPLEDAGNPNLSVFSKLTLIERVLKRIPYIEIFFRTTADAITMQARLGDGPNSLDGLTSCYRLLPNSEVGDTSRIFEAHTPSFLEVSALVHPNYSTWCNAIPLYQLAMQDRGDFSHRAMSLTFHPQLTEKETVFHEFGHYLEHVCPAVGVTLWKYIYERMSPQEPDSWETVSVGDGEQAYKPKNYPWLELYTGKTYKPAHHELPPPTEVLSMHLQSFANFATLCHLIANDRASFYLTLFVLRAGPLGFMQALKEYKYLRSSPSLRQKNHGPRQRYRYRYGRASAGPKNYGFGL